VAEPDPAGIGGLLGGGGDEPSVFRGKSSVNLEYKDVTGLVGEMNKLADAIKRVKSNLESLNSTKAQKAINDLKGITGGGGAGQGGGSGPNGGGPTFGNQGQGPQQGDAQSRFRTALHYGSIALGTAGLVGYSYARREQADLASDAMSVRATYASDQPSFGLREANRYASQGFTGSMLSREDRAAAFGSVLGRYGAPGSAGMNQAMSMASAFGAVSMQGAGFGAEVMNSLNRPEVLNRVRMFGGGTRASWGEEGAVGASRVMAKIAFGNAQPTNAQLNNFRPGTRQYENMVYLAGGDAQAATMQVEMLRADQRSRTMGLGPLTDKKLNDLSKDRGMQEKLFGENSLFMSKQSLESGKVVNAEEALDAARANLVTSNQWLSSIDNSLKGINQKFTQYMGPLGNVLNSIGGPIGQLADVASNLVLANAVVGADGGGLLNKGIPGFSKKGLGGAGGVGRALAGGAIMAGGAVVGQGIDSMIGNPKDKEGVDAGNILRYGATGAGIGAALGGGVFSPVGAAVGGAVGLGVGAAKEFLFGDPVDRHGRRVDEMQRVGDAAPPGGGMTVSKADEIIRSRGGAGEVTGIQPDFKIKLGQLFAMNPKLSLTSGYRSAAAQEKIYRERYRPPYPGAPLDAPGWVHVSGAPAAKPGKSNHGAGLAADIGPESQYGWLAANAPKVGLVKPMSYEPWHWEPPGATERRKSGVPSAGGEEAASGGDTAADTTGTAAAGAVVGASVGTARGGLGSTTQGGPGAAAAAGAAIGVSPGGGTAVGSAADAGTGANASGGTPWAGGAGSISINQAADYLRQAGVPESQVATGVAIGMAESSLRPTAHNPKPPDNSYGIWQINMLGKMGPDRRAALGLSKNEELFDPSVNARAAAMISSKGSNWQPWSTYGKHEQYMGQVQSALSSKTGDPVEGGSASMPSMSAAPTLVMGGGGGVQVRAPINIQVLSASEEEAYRLAKIIKGHLEGVVASVENARTGA
jgi:hypothetical protein